ncbi:MAG TPA: hypothetical protein RMG48_17635 [Myxococcales bacterium LLY-WYZ-16_1]|jgi:tetratricopeptide (TPR) repeat protein|nr:hypothetical protein [Myxococcales bacterium LLY-WYZ-16_1]
MDPSDAFAARVEAALAEGRWDLATQARLEWLEAAPETSGGAQAGYQAALALLFGGQGDQALERLRQVARTKVSPWAAMARTSMGLVLLRLGKPQQGMFELRKAAADAGLVGAQAQALLADALMDSNKGAEAEKARDVLCEQLRACASLPDPDGAYARLWLGMEYKRNGMRAEARRELEAAIASGALPDAERRVAEDALTEL